MRQQPSVAELCIVQRFLRGRVKRALGGGRYLYSGDGGGM